MVSVAASGWLAHGRGEASKCALEAQDMRYLFWFWLVPMSILWGWIGLAYNDISFGTFFLSRDNFDLVFGIYGSILNMESAAILPLLARACVVDSLLIFGIFAFRKRREIRAWWAARQQTAALKRAASADQPSAPAIPAE